MSRLLTDEAIHQDIHATAIPCPCIHVHSSKLMDLVLSIRDVSARHRGRSALAMTQSRGNHEEQREELRRAMKISLAQTWGVQCRFQQLSTFIVLAIMCGVLVACSIAAGDATPLEREQIKNVALSHFLRERAVPDYEATVEKVEGGWARVRISPVGVQSVDGSTLLYLKKQEVPADAGSVDDTQVAQPGYSPLIATDTGWTIFAGPQAQYSQAELDAAGIPAFIRPE